MIALYLVGGLLCLLVVLLFIPLNGVITYDDRGFHAHLTFLGISLRHPEKKVPKKKKPKAKAEPKAPKPSPKGGNLLNLLPYLRRGGAVTRDFFLKLKVPELTLHVTFGGRDDPAQAAIAYGAAWAFIGTVMTPIKQTFRIGREHLRAACDFTREDMTVFFSMCLRTNPGQLLLLLIRYAILAVKAKNSKKAVSNHESSPA